MASSDVLNLFAKSYTFMIKEFSELNPNRNDGMKTRFACFKVIETYQDNLRLEKPWLDEMSRVHTEDLKSIAHLNIEHHFNDYSPFINHEFIIRPEIVNILEKLPMWKLVYKYTNMIAMTKLPRLRSLIGEIAYLIRQYSRVIDLVDNAKVGEEPILNRDLNSDELICIRIMHPFLLKLEKEVKDHYLKTKEEFSSLTKITQERIDFFEYCKNYKILQYKAMKERRRRPRILGGGRVAIKRRSK